MAENSEKVQSIINEILKEYLAVTPITARRDRCLATTIKRHKENSKDTKNLS